MKKERQEIKGSMLMFEELEFKLENIYKNPTELQIKIWNKYLVGDHYGFLKDDIVDVVYEKIKEQLKIEEILIITNEKNKIYEDEIDDRD